MSQYDTTFAKAMRISIDEEKPEQTLDRFASYRESDTSARLAQALSELATHRAEADRLKRVTHNWQIAFFAVLGFTLYLAVKAAGWWPQ